MVSPACSLAERTLLEPDPKRIHSPTPTCELSLLPFLRLKPGMATILSSALSLLALAFIATHQRATFGSDGREGLLERFHKSVFISIGAAKFGCSELTTGVGIVYGPKPEDNSVAPSVTLRVR